MARMAAVRVAFLLVPLLLSRTAAAGDLLPLAEVRPGMQGVGRTVFEGARVDEFGVRILGVLENAVGPRQSLILARLEGGPLAETGVIAGMSGSPVFVDGKLVGAVAYAFPFGKQPIAGITPIGDMIAAAGNGAPRAAAARLHAPGPGEGPLDRSAVAAALRRPLPTTVPGAFRGEPLPAGVAGASLSPLALPLVFSGFEADTFDWARGVFSAMGFAPVMGGAGAGTVGPLPDLEPGASVGVSLVDGDLDLSVTGTVTHIDNGRVYAFGHPFYNLGPTRFPMKKAWVYAVFPSLQVSWKIAAAVDPVGTMDQDRTTAISGRLGEPPRMIPVEVRLRSARAGERTFRFRMVEDELFTPLLGYVSLLSVLQGHERALGAWSRRGGPRRHQGWGRGGGWVVGGGGAPLGSCSPGAARCGCGTSWPPSSPPSRRPPPSPAPSRCWSATTSRRWRSTGWRWWSTRWRRSRRRRWSGPGWTAPPPSAREPWRRSRSSSAPGAARR
jgi:hypothetical protein